MLKIYGEESVGDAVVKLLPNEKLVLMMFRLLINI